MAWDPVARFKEQALRLASTVEDVTALDGVPAAAARYLRHHGLPLLAVCWPQFADLPWRGAGLEVEPRAARDTDLVGITGAFCAIAETGTLMMLSGTGTPATVSLLPETHIAIVPASRIVRGMEEAWALARAELGGSADGGAVPAGFAGRCDPEAGPSATGNTRNGANTDRAAESNSLVRSVGTVALPRAVNFISGPSRTADIEQTVTVGAHGPYRVHIVLVG
jgi:L-lactate dehydrogenase complex protein LldG